MAKGYQTAKWNGKSLYECEYCPWSTLNEDAMKEHQAMSHPEEQGSASTATSESRKGGAQ